MTRLAGATGSIVFASEAIGPLLTLFVWIAILIVTIFHDRRISWIECLPVISGLVVLQLLLDLHTPYLGDLIVAGLHAVLVIALVVERVLGRRAR